MGKIEWETQQSMYRGAGRTSGKTYRIGMAVSIVAGFLLSCAGPSHKPDIPDKTSTSNTSVQVEKLFHCPPGMDRCVEIPLDVPDDYPGDRNATLIRVVHCPPGYSMCYQIELATVEKSQHAGGNERRLQRLFHCPPASEECVEIDLDGSTGEEEPRSGLMHVFHCPPSSEDCYEVDLQTPSE